MQYITRFFSLLFNHFLQRPYHIMLGLLAIVTFTLTIVIWQQYIYLPVVERYDSHCNMLADNKLSDFTSTAIKLLGYTTPDNTEYTLNSELNNDRMKVVGVNQHAITGDTINSVITQYGCGVTFLATSIYDRVDGGLKETKVNFTGKGRNTILLTGQLNGSFINSARLAGLTGSEINAVIKALQWQLDFRKLRKGDQFSVLTTRNDSTNTNSKLLGLRLRTGGKDYYAFRADDGKFYNLDAAAGLARGFMRFPTIKQFRVSSDFNPHRLNPITGRIAPHRGVDFAVPVGTPVLAVGDGEVIVSKQDRAAGNYVAIRHGRQYMTRYMHLKTLLVKSGQKVKRGACIALSGNTGRSTGPHLHYEVWINQQAVNPMTAKLPCTEVLIGNDRAEYLAQVKQILPKLQLN